MEISVREPQAEECLVGYLCDCGCTPAVQYHRSHPEGDVETCCCGRILIVGESALRRVEARAQAEQRDVKDHAGFEFEAQRVELPWGTWVEAALATPHELTPH